MTTAKTASKKRLGAPGPDSGTWDIEEPRTAVV
jgi:hypothetical protein